MFDRSDLESIEESRLTHWEMVGTYPGLYYTTYPQYAFRSPEAEETIRITRAPKLTGDDGLRFWLSAEWADDWRGRETYFAPYVRGAKFQSISEDEFNQIVASESSDLVVPLSLPLHIPDGFIGALLMYSTQSEFLVSLVAEYADEFIHFYWITTS